MNGTKGQETFWRWQRQRMMRMLLLNPCLQVQNALHSKMFVDAVPAAVVVVVVAVALVEMGGIARGLCS